MQLALLYSQIFRYPLTPAQLHRYCTAGPCTPEELDGALRVTPGVVESQGYYVLRGAQALVPQRDQRLRTSARLWNDARRVARLLAALPFVRMVAITGALAMDNAGQHDDIDLLLVTARGRLWLTRGLVVAVTRAAGFAGISLCPNYLIAEDNLTLARQDLFTAHELAQIVPIYGRAQYLQLWEANPWLRGWLPNAGPCVAPCAVLPRAVRALKGAAERLLGGPFGAALERWEYQRKSARLRLRALRYGGDVAFTEHECRGYFGGLEERVLQEFFGGAAAMGLSQHARGLGKTSSRVTTARPSLQGGSPWP